MDNVLDSITEWISSVGGISVLVSFAFTVLAKTVIAIFNKALEFRAKYLTMDQWMSERQNLLNEISNKFNDMKDDIHEYVNMEVKMATKDFNDIKNIVNRNANIDKIIDEKIKSLNDRYQKQTQLEAKVIYLERKVAGIESGNLNDDPLRRTDK